MQAVILLRFYCLLDLTYSAIGGSRRSKRFILLPLQQSHFVQCMALQHDEK